jgi:hypothetical protein
MSSLSDVLALLVPFRGFSERLVLLKSELNDAWISQPALR